MIFNSILSHISLFNLILSPNFHIKCKFFSYNIFPELWFCLSIHVKLYGFCTPGFTYFCFKNTKIIEIFTFSLFTNFFTLLYSFIHYKLFILAKLLPCYFNPLIIIL